MNRWSAVSSGHLGIAHQVACRIATASALPGATFSFSVRAISSQAGGEVAADGNPHAAPSSDGDDFSFEIEHQSTVSRARVGRLRTPHGEVETPAFVAVGTNAVLKGGLTEDHVAASGLKMMFANTYHLMCHPGPEVVADLGGLHAFIGRPDGVLMTDSGGFQAFSLAYGGYTEELKSGKRRGDGTAGAASAAGRRKPLVKVDEDGLTFRNYRNGSAIRLTPETCVAAQKQLGADIIIPLDELPPYHTSPAALRASLDRTHRWEARSLAAHLADRRRQAMYGVVHGGLDPDMRAESAAFVSGSAFDGAAIGGSFGRNLGDLCGMLDGVMPRLPQTFPVHLLGFADPASLEACVPYGVDTFDAAYPTQIARSGEVILAHDGSRLRLRSGKFKRDAGPIDPACRCPVCFGRDGASTGHSRAYLHHLFKAKEATGPALASLHNLFAMVRYTENLRERIKGGLI